VSNAKATTTRLELGSLIVTSVWPGGSSFNFEVSWVYYEDGSRSSAPVTPRCSSTPMSKSVCASRAALQSSCELTSELDVGRWLLTFELDDLIFVDGACARGQDSFGPPPAFVFAKHGSMFASLALTSSIQLADRPMGHAGRVSNVLMSGESAG
jgi:hypothetical protein